MTRLIALVQRYRQLMDWATDDFGMWPGRAFAGLNAVIGGVASFVAALPVAAVMGGGIHVIGGSAFWGALIGVLLTLVIVPANGIARWRTRRRSRQGAAIADRPND